MTETAKDPQHTVENWFGDGAAVICLGYCEPGNGLDKVPLFRTVKVSNV